MPTTIYPQHIAIIPDGNRTRATAQWKPWKWGHYQAYKLTLKLINYVFDNTPVKALTFRWLSTENLKQRSQEELDYLYDFALELKKDLEKIMKKHQINFKWAWNPQWLPEKVITALRELETHFSFPTEKYVVYAINYGWRDEILRWIKQRATVDGNIENLTEETFGQHLDFGKVPVVDLVIRTKGELASRLSGFLTRRIGYAELYFSSLHFPDFSVDQLKTALTWFDERAKTRNWGK